MAKAVLLTVPRTEAFKRHKFLTLINYMLPISKIFEARLRMMHQCMSALATISNYALVKSAILKLQRLKI